MSSSIQVYTFPDTVKYFITNKNMLDEIAQDTNTTLTPNNRKRDPFIQIKGKFEDCHKARIIIQDIEKDNYRRAYLDREV